MCNRLQDVCSQKPRKEDFFSMRCICLPVPRFWLKEVQKNIALHSLSFVDVTWSRKCLQVHTLFIEVDGTLPLRVFGRSRDNSPMIFLIGGLIEVLGDLTCEAKISKPQVCILARPMRTRLPTRRAAKCMIHVSSFNIQTVPAHNINRTYFLLSS
jgi:hypothetical protein